MNPQRLNPQLCFSTLGCPEFSLREAAVLARVYGFGLLELRCLAGAVIEPQNFATTLPEPSTSRTFLANHGLGVRVLSTSTKLFAATADTLHTLLAFAQVADELHAPLLRVFDGGKTGTPPTPEEWAAATALLADWQDLRRRLGLRCDLAVETHWALTDRAVTAEFLRRFPAANILWDTHHTWKAGVPLVDFWSVARANIRHLHVKDSVPDDATKAGWSYCLPGRGQFPWADLRALLRRDAYAHAFSLEWEKKWHPQLPPLPEALAAFRQSCTLL